MSAPAAAVREIGARSGAVGRWPVADALRAEWTKLRTLAGTCWLLLTVVVLTAAVTLVIVAIILPYILGVASILPVSTSDWLLRITPAAAFAIQQATPQYPQVAALYSPSSGYFPLAPWAGLAVLCAYAALALSLAVVLLRRRDT